MNETTYNRANSQQNITPNKGSRPKNGAGFNDLPMAALIPAGTVQENVAGVAPAPANQPRGFRASSTTSGDPAADASSLVADASQVDLGTDAWEELQLAKAIESLRQQYAQAATSAGGNITDPYWKSAYDKAVDAALDDIRTQSANDRNYREEAQKGRDFQGGQNAIQQAHEREVAREARKAAENSAMYGALGKGGMDYLTTPVGGKEAKLLGFDAAGNARYAGEDVEGTTRLAKGAKSAWSALKEGFSAPSNAAAMDYKTVLPDAPLAPRGYNGPLLPTTEAAAPVSPIRPDSPVGAAKTTFGQYLAPSAVGAGLGMMMPNKNKGNAALQALAGFGGSGIDSAFGGSTGWSKLISSFGGSWSNPFNKSSWGKNTGSTLAKLGGTALASRGLPALAKLIGL